ncbi:hypothetical protein HDR70_02475 [bacterium]|nr:hypothetical protein [bacterium]
MILNDLSKYARGLIAFHIYMLEQHFIGYTPSDTQVHYVRERNKALLDLNVTNDEIKTALEENGGKNNLYNFSTCLKAIQSNLKGNSQRTRVRNLLWLLIDELEFDYRYGKDHDPIHYYKWDLVNQIIKNKLFG